LPFAFALYRLKRRLFKGEHCELLPLSWMDEARPQTLGTLRRGTTIQSFAPRYFGGPPQTIVSIQERDLCYRVFSGARVSALSSSVVLNDGRLLVERLGEETDAFDYATGPLLMHGPRLAVMRTDEVTPIDKGIFLGGNGANNYYHWLVEIAAKSEFLPALPEPYRDFPVLLSEDVQRIPSFGAVADRLLHGRERIYLDHSHAYKVAQLVWIDTPNNLPFNLSGDRAFDAAFFHINANSIRYLQRQVLDGFAEADVVGGSPQRVFFRRRSLRRSYNHEAAEACLMRHGFEPVAMEELTLNQQISTVRSAEFIAGPTGAAWTNLIFCRPGTRCLCWMAEETGDFAAFSNIAAAVGVELDYLTGSVEDRDAGLVYQRPYRLDIDRLKAYLRHNLGVP
jgi:hypothetical protein